MSEKVLVHKWYMLEVSPVREDLGMRKEEGGFEMVKLFRKVSFSSQPTRLQQLQQFRQKSS